MDKYKLDYEMKSRNVSVDELCKACGISKAAYYRKRNGKTEFTRKEIQAIVNYLHLSSPVEIFFTDEVS